MSPRIELTTDRMLDLGIPDTGGICPSLEPARGALHRASDHLGHLDPLTTELVRLRNARTQRCHLCMNLRAASALAVGGNEGIFDEVDHYETSTMSNRHKMALRVADAYLGNPAAVTDADRASWQTELSDAEIIEIVLRLSIWTANKPMVALGLDGDDLQLATY